MSRAQKHPIHTLVVARYKEDTSWIKKVPENFKIVIYNKGARFPFIKKLRWNRNERISIRGTRNIGRESETYLRYLKKKPHPNNPDGFIVFCQGNPFEHSPDFLELLEVIQFWNNIQPLTFYYKINGLPPEILLQKEKDNFLNGLRIRLEIFSLYSMEYFKFYNEFCSVIADTYRSVYGLDNGVNISHHFLLKCGLPRIAASAASHSLGQFNYGAIFGIKNSILANLSFDSIHMMHHLSLDHWIHGFLFERLWLHIFGKEFLGPRTRIS